MFLSYSNISSFCVQIKYIVDKGTPSSLHNMHCTYYYIIHIMYIQYCTCMQVGRYIKFPKPFSKPRGPWLPSRVICDYSLRLPTSYYQNSIIL